MNTAPPEMQPYLWLKPELQLALRPTTWKQWTLVGRAHARNLQEKRVRLASAPLAFYRSLPESREVQAELRMRLVDHLTKDHAPEFQLEDGRLYCGASNANFDLADTSMEPLAQIAQFVEEDFMILQQSNGRLVITAAANAYSSSGRLVESVGYDVPWAHIPVPGLQEQLGNRIDRVMANIHPDFPSERFNWLITPIADLFFPLDPHVASVTAADRALNTLAQRPERCGDLLWLRVERQTLVRLPQSGAVVFGIHTFSDPLSSICSDQRSLRAVRDSLVGFSPERLEYLQMQRLRQPVLEWIGAQMQQ